MLPLLLPASSRPTTRRRDCLYRIVTRLLSVALMPVACAVAPSRARALACRWALAARFPGDDLKGLTPETRAAFEAARAEALWKDGELIGLTDGHREAHVQERLFADAVRRTGSLELALQRALPAHESRHVAGTALDVRPREGARWLEQHGSPHHLYRVYDNEWWHFEYRPEGRPTRLPHPSASIALSEVILA
jgi:D-alanyl-D-alanine dipeptidase